MAREREPIIAVWGLCRHSLKLKSFYFCFQTRDIGLFASYTQAKAKGDNK